VRVAELDPAFRCELEGLLAEARRSEVGIGTIVQTATGKQNVQTAGLVDSEVHVNHGPIVYTPTHPTHYPLSSSR
jgi:hypothetical protein